jgi:hypothetical protein
MLKLIDIGIQIGVKQQSMKLMVLAARCGEAKRP